jgi:hypothetical protein
LVDPLDELRVGLDEVSSCFLRVFELTDLSGEPGPLAFEKPNVRFGRALPGTLGHFEHFGTGLDVVPASVPGEDPLTAGILGTSAVLLVDSPRDLEVLVTTSDGRVRPSSGAGPEVGKVLSEGSVLLVDLGKLAGDERRDAVDESPVLGAKLHETLGGAGLVSGPLLTALVIPGPRETLGGFGEVRCGGVDVAGFSGSTHGHIGKLPATAVVEDVGDLDRRSLRAMSGDGVAVGEAVGADVFGAQVQLAAVGRDRSESLGLRVDGGDLGSL